MLQFIVLGLVPGTNIQIGFEDVLSLTASIFLSILLFIELRRILTHKNGRQVKQLVSSMATMPERQ